MDSTQKVSVREIAPGTSLISRPGRRSALTGRYLTGSTTHRDTSGRFVTPAERDVDVDDAARGVLQPR